MIQESFFKIPRRRNFPIADLSEAAYFLAEITASSKSAAAALRFSKKRCCWENPVKGIFIGKNP